MVVYRLSLVNIPVDTGSTTCITIANLNSPHSRFSNNVNDSEVMGTALYSIKKSMLPIRIDRRYGNLVNPPRFKMNRARSDVFVDLELAEYQRVV